MLHCVLQIASKILQYHVYKNKQINSFVDMPTVALKSVLVLVIIF